MFFLTVFGSLICINVFFFIKAMLYVRNNYKNSRWYRGSQTIVICFFLYVLFPIWHYLLTGSFPKENIESCVLYIFWYPGMTWMSASLLLFPIYLLKDVLTGLTIGIRGMVKKIRKPRNSAPSASPANMVPAVSRRQFLKAAPALLAVPPLAGAAYGNFVENKIINVERHTVSLTTLPPAFRGMTAVQFSDIHAGLFLETSRIKAAVRTINDLQPDIIMLTGDLIHNAVSYIAPCFEALAQLRAPMGIFVCLGNHDHWTDAQKIITTSREAGFTVLINESMTLSRYEEQLHIAGVDDLWSKNYQLENALHGIPADDCTILLAHQPVTFKDAAEKHVDLMLSGHTHGGQIVIPVFGSDLSLTSFFYEYVKGWYHIEESSLYVNSGFGFTGPPFRFNAPPEITHLTFT